MFSTVPLSVFRSCLSTESHPHSQKDSLPPFTLFYHAFDAVHRTIRTCDIAFCIYVIPLHNITTHFPGSTCSAGFCCSPLNGFRVAIAVETGG